MDKQLPTRSQVPTELTWDLTLLFENDQAMEAALEKTQAKASELAKQAGTITSADRLLAVLTAAKEIDEELEQEYVYAFLRRDSVS